MVRGETARYLASRLVTTVLIVLGAMLLLFTLSSIVPGDPATTLLGPQRHAGTGRRLHRRDGAGPAVARAALAPLLRLAARRPRRRRPLRQAGCRDDRGGAAEHAHPDLLGDLDRGADRRPARLLRGDASRLGSRPPCSLRVSVAFIATPSFVVAIFLLLIFAMRLDWFPVLGSSRRAGRLARSAASGPADRRRWRRLDRLSSPGWCAPRCWR